MSNNNNTGNGGIALWDKVLDGVLRIPGARVDRAKYLQRELSKHCPPEQVTQAIDLRPADAGVSGTVVDRIARSCSKWHRAKVTAISALTGLPGGWWMLGTVPTDLTQYFWHVVVFSQKMAYLYGWPELTNAEDELDDETRLTLTVFVGVMMGASAANKAMTQLSARLSGQVGKRLPRMALTKWGLYRLAKQIAKWVGIRLTKQSFARWVSKAIPLVGGALSGVISWTSFSAMSNRLLKQFQETALAKPEEDSSTKVGGTGTSVLDSQTVPAIAKKEPPTAGSSDPATGHSASPPFHSTLPLQFLDSAGNEDANNNFNTDRDRGN